MKLKEVTISRGQTRQFKQYEPTNFHVALKGEVGENEDYSKAFAELAAMAKKEIRKEIREDELELEAKAQIMKK